jgi:hypothetical protein
VEGHEPPQLETEVEVLAPCMIWPSTVVYCQQETGRVWTPPLPHVPPQDDQAPASHWYVTPNVTQAAGARPALSTQGCGVLGAAQSGPHDDRAAATRDEAWTWPSMVVYEKQEELRV